MELGIATLIGQLVALVIAGVIIYLVALIPLSLKRIATELREIKSELRKGHERRRSDATRRS
jgi:hypothetical protein